METLLTNPLGTVTLADYVAEGVTTLGLVFAACVGAYMSFLVAKKGFKFVAKYLG